MFESAKSTHRHPQNLKDATRIASFAGGTRQAALEEPKGWSRRVGISIGHICHGSPNGFLGLRFGNKVREQAVPNQLERLPRPAHLAIRLRAFQAEVSDGMPMQSKQLRFSEDVGCFAHEG